MTDGRFPIDHNPCENAIRPFVAGRRNWLFADTVGGANASVKKPAYQALLRAVRCRGLRMALREAGRRMALGALLR